MVPLSALSQVFHFHCHYYVAQGGLGTFAEMPSPALGLQRPSPISWTPVALVDVTLVTEPPTPSGSFRDYSVESQHRG